MNKNEKISKSMEGNTNAEFWTHQEAEKFLLKAVELSEDDSYDFIGEVAKDLKQDKGVFDYLIEKYPEFKKHKKRILGNCETNCFRNSKKGNIKEGTAIVNLKSNHGWTDRTDVTSKDNEIKTPAIVVQNLETSNELNKFMNENH